MKKITISELRVSDKKGEQNQAQELRKFTVDQFRILTKKKLKIPITLYHL